MLRRICDSMKTNRVLLINPNRMQPPVAPLGLEYLAAALEKRGFAVELLDLAWENDPLAAVRERLRQRRYGAVGISVRNTDDCSYATRDFFLPQVKELVGAV
ncbi:MAG: cobalamin B12-binding domain-containing protein, partial [Firmicutes bacterium]|nr:cobalamin B12-binding domain-containing protein [Bacillota bacterium]